MKHLKLFFALFAMLALNVGHAWGAALGSGYSKVTDISTLSAGDKVVIYCDDESVGVTGFNTTTKKDATVAETGWVEYLVESATGGVLLKDGDNYISLTTKNTFTYATTGSVCKVNSSGVLCCTLSGTDYFLYKNSTYYRMYVDKSSTSSYKPFYVYKVVAGGENPGEGGGEEPEEPEPGTGGEALSFTWDLSKKTYSAASNTQVTWSATDVNMVADKGTAGTAPNNYLGGDANNRTSSRFYQNSILTITPEANVTITSVVFTATSDSYATALKNSTWTNATATASSKTVTVTPTNGASAISATIGGTCGFTGVTVHYTKAASGEPEPVIVKTLKSIAVSGMTQTYQVGDAFSFDGTCTATYSVTKDGAAQADQTAKVEPTSVSTPDMTQVGTPTVTVTYTEGDVTKTAEYTITIEEAPTYNFTKIEKFNEWTSSYAKHVVTYSDAEVTFASACRQSGTITDQPVTKGGEVSLVLTDGMNIATVKWVCTQWTTKAQTITLHYSKDGGNVYNSTEITSSDFTISSDNLPAGTNAVKITFSSTANQVGIKSCTITKVEAAAITQVPAPQFSLQGGAYDGAQSVELTCTMADATIHYTTDGTTPTTSSAVYSTAIQVAENMTIKAYAVKEGLEDSPVVEAIYEISAPADVVLDFTTNDNDTWNFPTEKTVTATDYSNGDYTVTVAGSEGQGFMFDNTNKNLMIGKEGSYIVLPIFNKPIVKIVCEGVSSGSGSVTFNVFVDDEAVSTAVTSCKVDQTLLIAEDKQVANVAHVIKVTNAQNVRFSKIKIYLGEAPAVERPVIAGEEEFAGSTEVSITCATSGAKIYYTTDGTEPTNASAEYTAPFELSATTTVKAIAYADGQASAVATKTFTFIETITCVQAAEIALAQSANNVQTEKKYRIIAYVTETLSGVSSNQQSFKVVDNIGDESVFQSYYCNVPEAMAAGMKVEMIGKLSKYNTTAQMKNGDVTILEKPVAAPKILGADAFETSTEVTITAEEGMQIFYTLDGTTPTTGSTKYTAAFTLSATTTVKAIAYNSTTAKSSTVAEKTFTKTAITTKTIAEFIASQGGACYLEGIVSNIQNTQYGNFDLTDATGTIYIYGCLNANGEAKKFAELGVKEGDLLKVQANVYELYYEKHEAKNVVYVSHVSNSEEPEDPNPGEDSEECDGSDDFTTLNPNTTYGDKETESGWTAKNAAVDTIGFIINGKTSTVGTITSPVLNGGIGSIKIRYANTYSEANGVSFRLDIKQNGEVVKTYTITKANADVVKGTVYTELIENINVAGDFQMVFTNLSPSKSTSNKDRVSIGRLCWTGYEEVVTPTPDYTRTVTTGNYGTLCLPFGGEITGAVLYECVGRETGKVYLGSVTTLAAGVPYIFQATATELAVYSDGTIAPAGDHNGLYGTFDNETVVAAGNYILLGNTLRPSDGEAKVNANRAYLVMSEVPAGKPQQMPGRRYIGMDVQGENGATGVEDLFTTDAPVKVIENGQLIIIRDGVKYNIQGQKL